ncbi:uncharacterized protein DFL_005077 [Arthrobotrys flagrans]|uniref:Uncharacterized protein n=1 Tax=Arthrobotrys flagrans TaxID=97331 RepID=A0A437A715_ARTFL|nr:hypothetical protein DFL_005077 [Arthrobotrys flagrans]
MQGSRRHRDGSFEGNPSLSYFDIFNLPEHEGRPPKENVRKLYPILYRHLLKELERAHAAEDVGKVAKFTQEIGFLDEARDFFIQKDPGDVLFNRWLERRTAQGRRRSGSRRSPHTSGGQRLRPSPSIGKLRVSDALTSDSEVFRGASKRKGKAKVKAKVNFKLPTNLEVFNRNDEVLDSPSERRGVKKPGTQYQYSIPRDQYTGKIEAKTWKELGESPPPQEIQDAYARYPPLPLDELKFEPLAIDEPALSLPPRLFDGTTNHGQHTETELGNTEEHLFNEYTASHQDIQMGRNLRRRLDAWRDLRALGDLTGQQILQQMKEEEHNANRRIGFDAQAEAVNNAPRVPWQETARQRALEAQESYKEQRHALFEVGSEAEVANQLHRLDFETPGWMKSASTDPSYWAPGIMNPEYTEAKLLEAEANFNWGGLNVDWPAPPTGEQIARSNRQLKEIEDRYEEKLRNGEPVEGKEEEETRELTKEELRARVKETEPSTWWRGYQRFWLSKLLFGEHESLVDGREIATAPKRYRFKPSVYRLNDNLELKHVCSPGESYFEHLYFSNDTFIWPESLPKPPGRSARDRWIMELQETDALRYRDGLPQLDPIPGVTPTDLPYDPDLLNPPSIPPPSAETDSVALVPPQTRGRNKKPKFEDFLRARQEQGKQGKQPSGSGSGN